MSFLSHIIDLLGSIPQAFWGVIIGAFSSFGTVALTNHSALKRLREQFSNDRDVRIKEREANLRKEIYLAAAEALSAGIVSLGKLSDPTIPESEITKNHTDNVPVLAKVQIVASESTAKAIANLTTELNAAFLRLTVKRVGIRITAGKIAVQDGLLAGFSKASDQLLEAMRNHNIEGSTDKQRFKALEGNFKFEQDRIAESQKEKIALMRVLSDIQIDLTKEIFEETRELQLLALAALFAIRKELGLPINEKSLTHVTMENQDRQRANLHTVLAQIREYMPQEQASS